MLNFSVNDICDATGATLVAGAGDVPVTSVATDSRNAGQGALFVCFPGERADGNDFAPAVARDGAAAVAATREPSAELLAAAADTGCAVLRVENDDPTEFMLRLAGAWRRRNPQWAVVGVTGSVGKTTTKEMLAAGLASAYRVHKTSGNFNNLIGVPLTLLSADPQDQVVVVEMGMNHEGELTRLTHAARPDVAAITNVGTSHIGLLGSREGIARAKAEIVSGMGRTGEPRRTCIGEVDPRLFLTGDNDFAGFIESEYCKPAGLACSYVGASEDDAVRRGPVSVDGQGRPDFDVTFADGWSRHVTLDVPGTAVAADFLLAMAVCDRLGADRAAAAEAIEHMPAAHMRLEVVSALGRPRVIDDSYNASPSSMAAALDVLMSMPCGGRRVAVLGEVGELGDEARRLHGYIGAYVAAKSPDLVVWVGGGDAAEMREAALVMGYSEDKMESFADAASALATMTPVFTQDDLVLVKASRAAGLDAFVKGVLG
ncbi:MAG: UDP-N-acetylmuramoyl-tripeptide--D-alanyl-D-alanine ligase [Olegusella sp.]|nr:UDP-N-acetylmuramoyl-tripeptide--D-alanyl-D-alanine ligase [Olegusella sp.]